MKFPQEKNNGLSQSKTPQPHAHTQRSRSQAIFQLQVFGHPQLTLKGNLVTIPSGKISSLLYYLIVTRRSHSRQKLAGMFWGEMSEERARANLRVTLVKLRRLLPNHIEATRKAIAFQPYGQIEIDSLQFEQCLQKGSVGALETAVSLWVGDFFEGLHLSGAPLFEDWVRSYREYCHLQMEQALTQLIKINSKQQHYARALSFTRQLLELHPWCEEAHRHAMILLTLMGQRSAALTQYKLCRIDLQRDLDVEPESFTETLYTQILSGRLEQTAIQKSFFY